MSNKVMSWNVAIENGYNPGLYAYDGNDIAMGEIEAILEFKIWAKNTMGISCYFSEKQTGKRFRLTVFRQPATKAYTLDSGGISFVESPVSCTYLLKVSRNDKGRIVFETAEVVQEQMSCSQVSNCARINCKRSGEANNILDIAPPETVQELNVISDELLKKAGLIEMNEKLKTF